jgi:short subunit dehydrogenase-like uncharacterized protein
MTKRITILGATGYTGRLIAQELAHHEKPNWDLQLAGRSEGRLARLVGSLPSSPKYYLANPKDSDTLIQLCQHSDVLINCVGPFTDLGEPVVAQAAKSGTHYLDITNELGFVHQMKRYGPVAQASGAAIILACGFEVALSDCAASLLAAQVSDEIDEISVVYDIQGQGSSYGTRQSAIRSLGTSWLAFQNTQWLAAVPCREVRRVKLDRHWVHALSFPSSEIATIPMHANVRTVSTWMKISAGSRFWAPIALPLFARLVRGLKGILFTRLSRTIAPAPPNDMRREASFTIRISAIQNDQQHKINITGKGVYELTAKIAAYAAIQLANPAYDQVGILAPSMALNPKAFLEKASQDWDLTSTYEIG